MVKKTSNVNVPVRSGFASKEPSITGKTAAKEKPSNKNIPKNVKRIPTQELLYYPPEEVPPFIQRSPRWKRIRELDDELASIYSSNIKFSDYVRRIKKVIDEIKRETDAEYKEDSLEKGDQSPFTS